MPIYEYRCDKCQKRFERIQKVADPLCKKCPHCGGPIRKMISSPSFQFKGSGFYVNDYTKKNSPPAETEKKTVDKAASEKPVKPISENKSGKD